jgi:release factor glutamine methyltransferase
MAGKVDMLLFNPPYVVTPDEEVERKDIAAAWAGGKDGRLVIDRLLPIIPTLLSDGGVAYMVVIPENKPQGNMPVYMLEFKAFWLEVMK